jgi:hypothetical protein
MRLRTFAAFLSAVVLTGLAAEVSARGAPRGKKAAPPPSWLERIDLRASGTFALQTTYDDAILSPRLFLTLRAKPLGRRETRLYLGSMTWRYARNGIKTTISGHFACDNTWDALISSSSDTATPRSPTFATSQTGSRTNRGQTRRSSGSRSSRWATA